MDGNHRDIAPLAGFTGPLGDSPSPHVRGRRSLTGGMEEIRCVEVTSREFGAGLRRFASWSLVRPVSSPRRLNVFSGSSLMNGRWS